MKIYFAASISGGREDITNYQMIARELRDWGEVFPEAVFSPQIEEGGEEIEAEYLFEREQAQIEACDYFVLEATKPSFGVGFQTAQALQAGKPVLALYRREEPLSAILIGSPVEYEAYSTKRDLRATLDLFFRGEL